MVLLRYIIKQPNCEEEELYQINPKFRHNNENVNENENEYYNEYYNEGDNKGDNKNNSLKRYIQIPEETMEKKSVLQEDRKFIELQKKIEEKKKYLAKKEQENNEEMKKKDFLLGVKDDYTKYNKYIKMQKEQQIEAFNYLKEYFTKLTTEGMLSDEKIEEAKRDQEEIVKTITNIKNDLEEMITKKKSDN